MNTDVNAVEKGSDILRPHHRYCVYWLFRANVAGGWNSSKRHFETIEGARFFGAEVAKKKGAIRGHVEIKDRQKKWAVVEKVW